jgi:phosphoribosylamine--glycine ligase
MIIENEPFLIEFNVRMGDPECQTILPLLNSDLGEIIYSCCTKNLSLTKIDWSDKKSLCIVLCSKGYPDKYEKNVIIENLEKLKLNNDQFIFHAGTKLFENKFMAIGGRVLNIVVTSNNFNECKNKAIKILEDINWSKGFYRKDIGYKVVSQ